MTSRHFHWINSLLYTALLSRIIFLGQHGTNASALINRIKREFCAVHVVKSASSLLLPHPAAGASSKCSAFQPPKVPHWRRLRRNDPWRYPHRSQWGTSRWSIELHRQDSSPSALVSGWPGHWLQLGEGGKWGGPFCTNIGSDCNFSSGCPQCQCCCKLTKMWQRWKAADPPQKNGRNKASFPNKIWHWTVESWYQKERHRF